MQVTKSLLLTVILLGVSMFAQAQRDTTVEDENNTIIISELENTVETLTEQADETPDYSELVDDLLFYTENKINLNNPDYSQLINLFGLTDYQVYHLQQYLHVHGQMYSIYELSVIEGMDRETIFRLMKYADVYPIEKQQKLNLRNAFKYGKNRILMRYGQTLEKQQGYIDVSDEVLEKRPNAVYLGSPQSYLIKYTFNYNNRIRFGFTADKDAGEEFFKGSNKWGFDFYSLHLFVKDISIFKTIAVGDYHASFGQGLVISTNFSLYKPDNAVGIYKNPSGIRCYTSANEANFFRGVATTLDCKVMDLTLFYSCKKIDAVLSDTLSNEELYIETLYETGYHRTQGEMAKKNAIGQHIAGMHLERSMRIARIGATACYTYFEVPLNRNLSLYNGYEFNQQDNINASVDYRVLIKKTSMFGEIAMSKNLAIASINGMIFTIDPRFSLSILHRYYGRNYQALHANAFGENASNANEHGIFLGYKTILSKNFSWDGYIDYFRFKWLRYRIDAPSDGYEVQTKLSFKLNNQFSSYIRFRYKSKALNYATDYYNELTQTHRQSYRFHLVYSPFQQLTLKSRIDIINYKASDKTKFHQGYMIYQEIQWKIQRIPLTLIARIALFDTYSYDERIYTYESDVLYTFSSPFFYDKGSRIYLTGKVSITSHIDLWVKVAQTFYRNKNSIGSGLTYIDGNKKTEIRCQILLKF
ncbi:MAG: hypothetical protein LBG80_07735 [Bacteroidales bacterium]|jgi:hypothetical protein|nr:hypothetical protein [Bacteroidales bacterium]